MKDHIILTYKNSNNKDKKRSTTVTIGCTAVKKN